MPVLQCTHRECGERFFEASRFADQCIHCGAPALPVDDDEDPRRSELAVPGRDAKPEQAHPAHAREMARRVLREHSITRPPVPVPAIVRKAGLSIRERRGLGSLSARLIDNTIEVAVDEPETRKRFSIAHELGHHFLRTQHDSGPTVESEANAFAGELLVPGHFLRAALEKTTSIDELRRLFGVSSQVIEIAAENHKLADRIS